MLCIAVNLLDMVNLFCLYMTDARARDKRMLMDEIIDLKKTITKLEAETSFKDSQLLEAKNELDKSATALKNAETKIITYKSQVTFELTHCSRETRKRVIGKQCRPRSDATECSIWSGSPLFANCLVIFF